MLRRLLIVLVAITALTAFASPGRPLKTDESMPWLPEYVDMLLGLGVPSMPASGYTGACDTITGGCQAAYSTSHSLVASYSGPLFELIQQAPVWTGTGYISGTTFTVASTVSGSLSPGVALSAAGSGTTPALTPITYITGGSGPYTVNNSQTAGSSGSPLTMAAYAVLDIGQSAHAANLSGIPDFCKSAICLYEKIFNEAGTGPANDLIASNVKGGNTWNPDCTGSIVACAPLYWLDPNLSVAMAPESYPTGMEVCAGAAPCTTSGMPTGNTSKSVIMAARPDIYTTCCGEFGLMEPIGSDPTGSMFAIIANLNGAVFGCTTAGEWCVGADLEGSSKLANFDGGTSQQNIYELRYAVSGPTLSFYVNNSSIFSAAPPTTPAASSLIRLGLAGDRSTAPVYFYDGLITNDSGDHSAAYSNLATWYAARSANPLAGPLDVAFYVNPGTVGAANGYQSALIGNARAGYSGRCLTASYTGPVADLTDSEGSPVTHTYGCINGAIDPAAAAFCGASPPCRISGLYVQAPWSAAGGNASNIFDPLLKLTCPGGLSTCPTMSFSGSANALNREPTMHFSGGQCLLSSTLNGYVSHVLSPWEIGAVMRRTSGTTYQAGIEWGASSYYFLGAGNSANTAAFSNGQAFGSGTASDGHWHSLIADTTTNSTGTLYVDGSVVGTASNNAGEVLQSYVTVGCGWNGSAIINPLNGDIAEVWMQHRTLNASGTLTSRVSTILTNDEAFWGALPN
ncbi:MAG TPA: arabinofuranosidase catalytic domain-containing protein [Stellaceae bacterium]|nr:arabinofuranosidase catalytic domain-containing protein [Stellaceae bacterium]